MSSENGTGFWTNDNKSPNQVPAGTGVYNPGTGKSGTADGYGGVHVNKP